MSKYQENERENAPKRDCFNNDRFKGCYRNIGRDFVLSKWENNFHKQIDTEELLKYFKHNKISWWSGTKPTGHILSSQIACLNYLFAIRNDHDAVLRIAKNINPNLVDVLILNNDTEATRAYITFEAVTKKDHLNECEVQKSPTRGSNCTSIDALILAKDHKERKILIPIEWKYTEWYGNTDKSSEDGKNHEKGSQISGKERLKRYTELISESEQLKYKPKEFIDSVYFHEPFYQLMRQTLWAEQLILNKEKESIQADDFIHVHVIPKGNHDLLKDDLKTNKRRKAHSFEIVGSMEEVWKSCLKDPDKYKIISPQDLMYGIDNTELIYYLSIRYQWENVNK